MLVLAAIDVVPSERGKGYMRELLAFMERLVVSRPELEGLYVEAVNNEDLIGPLMRRGFQVNRNTDPMGNGWGADWFILRPAPTQQAA
jgi:GNAT superfamily N-acetyltransferase